MNRRQQTALALGIAEWATAVEHMAATANRDRRTEVEFLRLIAMWPGESNFRDTVAQARRWVTQHPQLVEELLPSRLSE